MSGGMSTGAMVMLGTSMAATIASSIAASNSQRAQGAAQEDEKNYEASIANQNAGQVEAASQRTFIEQNRETSRTESNAIAAGAGSGGSASDPTVMTDVGKIKNEGDLRAANALYEGSSKAQALRNNAALDTYQGSIDQKSANINANTTLMNGASSLFSKYATPFIAQGMSGGGGGDSSIDTAAYKLNNSGYGTAAYSAIDNE